MIDRDYYCNCGREARINGSIHELEYMPLVNGHHTSATAVPCTRCHGFIFMPEDNVKLFLSQGVPEEVESFEGSARAAKAAALQVVKLRRTYRLFGFFMAALCALVLLAFVFGPALLIIWGHK